MHVRFALIATALALVACSERTPPKTAVGTASTKSVAEPWIPQGTEFAVRMNDSVGPGVSKPGDTFTAQLVTSLLSGKGVVAAPTGALLHGHVVAVDPTQQRIELSFDRIQSPDGSVLPIAATVTSATPWALTVRASSEPSPSAKTAVLQARTPGAIGGGPGSAIDQTEELTGVVVPFGAELKLMITQPVERPR